MDTIQLSVRGVPVTVADHLKQRAAEDGKSLNAYVVDLLSDEAARKLAQDKLLAQFAGKTYSPEEIAAHEALIESYRKEWVE